MNLTIRNYRAVERADLDVSQIALVAALNGSGKTCIVQAAQAVLTRNPCVMPGSTKKAAARLVRRGGEEGYARIERDGASATVTWPKCTETGDAGAPVASEIAVGLSSILDMKPEQRAATLVNLLKALPSQEDVKAAMTELGYSETASTRTWDTIQKEGWDKTHKQVVDYGSTLRDGWVKATGDTFGAARIDGWKPAGWREDIERDEAVLAQRIAEAQKAVESAIGSGAVAQAEIDRLRGVVASGQGIDIAGLEKAVEAAAAALAKAQAERDALPVTTATDTSCTCPECGVALVADLQHRGKVLLKKQAEPLAAAELDAQRKKKAEADGTVENLKTAHLNAEKALREARTILADATAAQEAIDKAGDASGEDPALAHREALALAQADLAMVVAERTGRQIAENWKRNAKLIDQLAPDGLRRARLGKVLAEFNAKLAALCATAQWEAVRLDEALDVHYGAEPIWNVSESEDWRARVTLQVQMARMDGSAMVLIDRADLLDYRGRNGLFQMLRGIGLPALVGMTMNDPKLMPPLASAGLGRCYWLADGIVSEVAAEKKEAA